MTEEKQTSGCLMSVEMNSQCPLCSPFLLIIATVCVVYFFLKIQDVFVSLCALFCHDVPQIDTFRTEAGPKLGGFKISSQILRFCQNREAIIYLLDD